jgi:hypothetical protein
MSASSVGDKLGTIGNEIDYSMLNNPKIIRKYVFFGLFIIGSCFAIFQIYSEYSINKKLAEEYRKPIGGYIIKLLLIILAIFIVSYIFGYLVEVSGTMAIKQAVLMCKKYGFEEGTPMFQKCMLDEQRAREMRNMIASQNNRNGYYDRRGSYNRRGSLHINL